MLIKNIFKIAVLGLVGFGVIVYFTVDKPLALQASTSLTTLTKNALPDTYELVGVDAKISKEELFEPNAKTLIVVGNHDSLPIVKDLKKYFEVSIPYVMVANISKAPWFVKKLFIPSKLKALNEGTEVPMIYDFDGLTAKSLNVPSTKKTAYYAYLMDENEKISLIYTGKVKEGALDGTMSEEEIKLSLVHIINAIRKAQQNK